MVQEKGVMSRETEGPGLSARRRLAKFLGVAACGGALLIAGSAAVAQDVEERPTWQELTHRDKLPNKIGIDVEYRNFSGSFADWLTTSVQYSHKFPRSSVILRANHADRFNRTGTQFEIDAYPKLRPGTYLFLNYGYSDDTRIFPEHRYSGEIFQSLPRSFEASLGFRQLEFANSDVTLWTGSVARYFGNNWLELRPWFNEKDDSSSLSGSVRLRHYLRGADDYWTLRGSYGEKEDDLLIAPNVANLEKWSVGANIQRLVRDSRWIVKAGVGYEDREFRPGRSRSSTKVDVGLHYLF